MISLLAQIAAQTLAQAPAHASAGGNLENVVIVVGGLTILFNLANLATTFIQRQTGRDGQRQIEPTQIAALGDKLDKLSENSSATSREMGELKSSVKALDKNVSASSERQSQEIAGIYERLNTQSTDIAAIKARVEILERKP